MITKTTSVKKRLLATVMVMALLLTATVSILPASAAPAPAAPTLVDGRILTPDESGDIVDWVEIAQYNGSSLIVRSSYINIIGGKYYGDHTVQYFGYGTNNNYMNSFIRDRINHWFSGVANYADWEDVLAPTARLRDYSLQHNAIFMLGTRYTPTTETDGLSLPTKYQVGIGNDIAFALSYSEVANYMSTVRNWKGIDIPYCYSPAEAIANYEKIKIPAKTATTRYGMWLRSPGAVSTSASALLEDGYAHELSVPYQTANNLGYGLIYPALWVDSGIFKPTVTDYNITYFANNGTDEYITVKVPANSECTVEYDGFTKSGYTFESWNTEPDGSGTTYPNGAKIIVTSDINLYAQWKLAPSIVYHANGSGEADIIDYGDDGIFTIKAGDIFNYPGFAFVEWNTEPEGLGATFPAGLKINNSAGTLDLYAIWIYES